MLCILLIEFLVYSTNLPSSQHSVYPTIDHKQERASVDEQRRRCRAFISALLGYLTAVTGNR